MCLKLPKMLAGAVPSGPHQVRMKFGCASNHTKCSLERRPVAQPSEDEVRMCLKSPKILVGAAPSGPHQVRMKLGCASNQKKYSLERRPLAPTKLG